MANKKQIKEEKAKNPSLLKFIEAKQKAIDNANTLSKIVRNTHLGKIAKLENLIKSPIDEFNPEGDFLFIKFKEKRIYLSPMQSKAIEYMYNEQKAGRKPIYAYDILDACGCSIKTTLHGLFKNKNVMGNLILREKNRYYYLDI